MQNSARVTFSFGANVPSPLPEMIPAFANALMLSLAQETFEHTQLSIVDVLPKEEIEACQKIADDRGIYLKIRKFS